jgi:hypothetical protein
VRFPATRFAFVRPIPGFRAGFAAARPRFPAAVCFFVFFIAM